MLTRSGSAQGEPERTAHPRETVAVLEYAQLFLGPDFGPMHLVPSVGIPCMIAFSAAVRPCVWYPDGRQQQIVYHQTSCHGCKLEASTVEARRCLTSIAVAEMA
jgi:ADP-heptose:LPS heptosyltransferase